MVARRKGRAKRRRSRTAHGDRPAVRETAAAARIAPRDGGAAGPGLGSMLRTWVAEQVEQAAVGALRRVVDAGGASLAAVVPGAARMRRETGGYVRELRELAGLTRAELAQALEMRDVSLLEAVETGTATLSFELILRLAAILARHDPVPFVSKLARTYNPMLWDLLRDWGVGRLPLQLEREREFVNVLRSRDDARALSDADFAVVLRFVDAAFEMALRLAAGHGRTRHPRRPRTH
jgi:transcriptional regulator with XRE-family HTH domain